MTKKIKDVRSREEAEELLNKNTRMASWFVDRNIASGRVPPSDRDILISYAYEGLWRACQLWRPEVAAFSTYAHEWLFWARSSYERQYKRRIVPTLSYHSDEFSQSHLDCLGVTDNTVERREDAREARIKVKRILRRLKPRDRKIIIRRMLRGEPLRVIAEHLNVTKQCVDLRVKAIMQKLRTQHREVRTP